MSYARWATNDEIKSRVEGVNLETGVTKSGLPVAYDDKYLYIDKGEAHNLLIGSTGSGKTQAVILPLIKLSMLAKESIIVNDPKGELYEKTAESLKNNKYDVYVLDFDDARKGNGWNPLTLAFDCYKDNKDKSLKIIEDLGYYLFTDENEKNTDPFWTNSTINYFTGLVLYLFDHAKEEEIHLGSVLNLSNEIGKKGKSKEFLEGINISSKAYVKLIGTLNAPPETRGSILSVFNQKIERYVCKENLENLLSYNDINLQDISNKPTAIFIVSGINSYSNNLIPLLVNQIVDAISMINKNERRINILLDEFDSMIPIKDFGKILNYCRSLNIKITITIQSYIHLNNMYSKEETEILKMCFGNIIYLLSEDIYTLKEISNYCGMIDNKDTPLISIEDLKTLNPFEAIIIMPRTMPYKTKLLPDYKIDWGYNSNIVDIPIRKFKELNYYNWEK